MEYFLAKAGQKPMGPLSREQVRELLKNRSYLLTDLVWTAAQKDWMRINDRVEFSRKSAPASSSSIAPRLGYDPSAPVTARFKAPVSRAALYEACVGSGKIAYYGPVFEQMDLGKGATSWNWPAALFTSWWMLYRGMFLWGLLWYPILSWLVTMAVMMVVLQLAHGTRLVPAVLVVEGVLVLISIGVMGFAGNHVFHSHVRKKIEVSNHLGLPEDRQREWLQQSGRTRGLVLLAIVPAALALVGAVAMAGMPMYQDYVHRSRVEESLVQLSPLKDRYAAYLAKARKWPKNIDDLGIRGDSSFGPDVASVTVGSQRELRVTFSRDALAGKTLLLTPEAQGSVLVWRCSVDDLPQKYAPSECR